MTLQQQEAFIKQLYHDLFREADVDKVAQYCAPDFVEDNNYNVLNYEAFVAHVSALGEQSDKVSFDFEFLVNVPGAVVIRTLVRLDNQIDGAPPVSLLISYWGFNEDGKVNVCKEVEYPTS